MFRILRSIKSHLEGLAADLVPETLAPADAQRWIELLAAIERLAAGMRLLLARRVDTDGLFDGTGERSAADWLAKTTGRSTRDAERDLECSRRLKALPDSEEAVRHGELSDQQAKAVADGATADPAAEDELLDTARKGSFGELARKAKARKAAALGDDEARHAAAHRNRALSTGVNEMGEGWGRFNGPASDLARLRAALGPHLDACFETARREGRRERTEALAYDALLSLLGIHPAGADRSVAEARAETTSRGRAANGSTGPRGTGSSAPARSSRAAAGRQDDAPASEARHPERRDDDVPPTLFGEPEPTPTTTGLDDDRTHPTDDSTHPSDDGPATGAPPSGTDPDPPPPAGPAPVSAPRRTDAKLILRVDATALRRGHTEPGELCDIVGIGPVPVAALQEFLPDAAIEVVVTNGVDAFNVTSLTRRANARQQTVLQLLNIGCSREGCNTTTHLQVDHRIDWAHIHVTELANLDWLCPHDHRLKTHHGWQLEPGTGKRPMHPPERQWWNQPDARRPSPTRTEHDGPADAEAGAA